MGARSASGVRWRGDARAVVIRADCGRQSDASNVLRCDAGAFPTVSRPIPPSRSSWPVT